MEKIRNIRVMLGVGKGYDMAKKDYKFEAGVSASIGI
jgi:hypothetical protein